jgi:uncharacterized protein
LRYTFDSRKLALNVSKHQVWFDQANDFEWETALLIADQRKRYPETRFQAIGYIGNRLYVMIFCLRANEIRIISLRKTNRREIEHYAEA